MRIRLNQWIDGLKEDWCISRQRFFGISFPVWYSKRAGEEGKLLFADFDQLPVDPLVDLPKGYSREEVQADMDVLDTWATSSISPQLNSKGISKDFAVDSARHAKLFPADLRPQAHEIIRTWAFYTIVKAHLHEDQIPWKNLMISGWCLASDKTKMSKSKGNVVTPVALIEEKGTDSVRYWASTSRLGADTAFSEDLLKIGRKLVNKIWNASQFAAINLDKLDGKPTTATADTQSGKITASLDLWVLSRLQKAVAKATEQFELFEYCDARVAIEDFFWNDFCDNYLELVKARAYGEGVETTAQQSALYTIYHCLDAILRLFAPFVPHISEELYSHIFDDKYANTGSVHARGQWPSAADYPYDAQAEIAGMACVDVLNIIRKAKSEAGVSIKFPVESVALHTTDGAAANWQHVESVLDDLKAAGTADMITQAAGAQATTSDKGWFTATVTLKKEAAA
jgi:valyl-tRNA synthetase